MKQAISVFACLICAASLLKCTVSGSGDVAGASGSGNPGGSVKVAIIADTGFLPSTLSKFSGNPTASPVTVPVSPVNPETHLPITDSSNLSFIIDSARVTVQRIKFILDADEQCDRILSEFKGEGNLTCDSGNLVLEGPFVFDMLTGMSVPPLDSVRLPEAAYRGVLFEVRNENAYAVQDSPFKITGTMNYNDTLHPFAVHLNSANILMLRKGPPISISRELTISFVLRLAADLWLNSIDLRDCIDRGFIPFNSDGVLQIDRNIGTGPCAVVEATIRENLINSGRLEITSW